MLKKILMLKEDAEKMLMLKEDADFGVRIRIRIEFNL
jgi:hypothetical protein